MVWPGTDPATVSVGNRVDPFGPFCVLAGTGDIVRVRALDGTPVCRDTRDYITGGDVRRSFPPTALSFHLLAKIQSAARVRNVRTVPDDLSLHHVSLFDGAGFVLLVVLPVMCV